jgi:uncharacterized protein (TIGR02996 family)
MTDLLSLIRAVVRNPQEETPVSMLADHLLENGDGRGEILRQWAVHPEKRLRGRDWYGREQLGGGDYHSGLTVHKGEGEESKWEKEGMATAVSAGPGHVNWWLSTNLPRGEKNAAEEASLTLPSRQFIIRTTPEEARQIADGQPNAKEIHSMLDQHYGPDTRAEKFCIAMGQVLKGTGRS